MSKVKRETLVMQLSFLLYALGPLTKYIRSLVSAKTPVNSFISEFGVRFLPCGLYSYNKVAICMSLQVKSVQGPLKCRRFLTVPLFTGLSRGKIM